MPTAVAGKIYPVALGLRQGDVLGSFSLRGPTAGVTDLTKPDITGPGVDILAAKNPANNNYGLSQVNAGESCSPEGSAAYLPSGLMAICRSGK